MSATRSPRGLIWLAFALIYIVWGTTYLAISVAIETIPPLTMSGSRFLIGGGLLFVIARSRWGGSAALPTRREWLGAGVAGFLLFFVNNGLIVWAEHNGVPTGVVALLIGTTPMWITLLNWARNGARPSGLTWAGLLLGMLGIGLLVDLSDGPGSANLIGVVAVVVAALAWAAGSLYARGAALPRSPLMSTASQLLWGAALQSLLAVLTGELAALNVADITLRSLLAMLYLAIVSSIIAFTAFTWLMRTIEPARVATYAFVNPVIAFILGWLLLGEPISARTVLAAAVIVAAVALILRAQGRRPAAASVRPERPAVEAA